MLTKEQWAPAVNLGWIWGPCHTFDGGQQGGRQAPRKADPKPSPGRALSHRLKRDQGKARLRPGGSAPVLGGCVGTAGHPAGDRGDGWVLW